MTAAKDTPLSQARRMTAIEMQMQKLVDEMATVRKALTEISENARKSEEMRNDTHMKMTELYDVLMKPQVGQGGRGLLERMADVTVSIETGDRAAERLVKWAQRLSVVGMLLMAVGAAILRMTIEGNAP